MMGDPGRKPELGVFCTLLSVQKLYRWGKVQRREHKFFFGDEMTYSFHTAIYKKSDGRYNDYNFFNSYGK